MSKRKSGATLLAWLSARPDCKDGRFVQVGNSLLLSEQFQTLSAGARFTYFAMCMESGGKREFVFPLAAAKKYGIASMSLRRQIDELVNSGFITVRSGACVRAPNIYSFSFDWKSKSEP